MLSSARSRATHKFDQSFLWHKFAHRQSPVNNYPSENYLFGCNGRFIGMRIWRICVTSLLVLPAHTHTHSAWPITKSSHMWSILNAPIEFRAQSCTYQNVSTLSLTKYTRLFHWEAREINFLPVGGQTGQRKRNKSLTLCAPSTEINI